MSSFGSVSIKSTYFCIYRDFIVPHCEPQGSSREELASCVELENREVVRGENAIRKVLKREGAALELAMPALAKAFGLVKYDERLSRVSEPDLSADDVSYFLKDGNRACRYKMRMNSGEFVTVSCASLPDSARLAEFKTAIQRVLDSVPRDDDL